MASDPIVRLRQTAEILPADLRADVLALGDEAVPDLVALLDDDEASMEDSPGDGWPPIHAVTLLADIKVEAAIEPMLRALVRTDWMSILHDRLISRLPEFGPSVAEPALSLLALTEDRDVRQSLCAVLARLGLRDDRIYDALCRAFDDDSSFGSSSLYDYGDPAALPLLERALEAFEPNFESVFHANELAELIEAFESLGGTVSDALQARIDGWYARWDDQRSLLFKPAKPAVSRKVGRNDPCPCGSGKKYKKCHIDAEIPR